MISRGWIPFRVAVTALFGLAAMYMAPGQAGEVRLADPDCAQILEQWQRDPDSVPKALVDTCKEQLAAAPAAAPAELPRPAAPLAATDPCAGPDAASSVYCWGPWATLAPAAGPPEMALGMSIPLDIECRFEIAEDCGALLAVQETDPPPLPLDGCPPGTPCGFATVVDGVTSSDDADGTVFARIDVAADGSQFTIDPDDGRDDIASVTGMGTIVTPRDDGYEELRSTGRAGDQQSRLVARVLRNDDGDLLLAADVWTNGNRGTGAANSGYFAWGTTTSQAGLDALTGGGATLAFTGPMSVDNSTIASLTVDFGASPSWSGTWTNPAWSFGAGGAVTGADLISRAEEFTPNVAGEGSFVQGALLGEAGDRGLAHIIDVTLSGHGHIKDVGLLRETAGPMQPNAVRR